MATLTDIFRSASGALKTDSQKPDSAKELFKELMNKNIGSASQYSLTPTSKDTLSNRPEIGQPLERGIQNDQVALSVEGPVTVKDWLNRLNQAPKQPEQQPQSNLAGTIQEDRGAILAKIGDNLRKLASNQKEFSAQIAQIDAVNSVNGTNAPVDMQSPQASHLPQRLTNQAQLMRETEIEVAKVSDNPYLKHLYDHKLEAFKLGLAASVKTLNDTNKQYNLGLKDAIVPEHLRPGQQQSQPVQAQHVMHNVIERWKQDPTQTNGSNMSLGALS